MPKVSDKDGERELVEHVYEYLAHNRYPEGSDKNHKRIVRKRAKKFLLKDGELHYKVEKNGKVCYIILGVVHRAFTKALVSLRH